jgi:hypothetical protein
MNLLTPLRRSRRTNAAASLHGPLIFLTMLCVLALTGCASATHAASPWHSPMKLPRLGQGHTVEPYVVVDSGGEAVAVWKRSGPYGSVIQSAARPTGGTWSAPVNISPTGKRLKSFQPQIAVSAAGEVLAVWAHFQGGHEAVAQSAARRPDGTWSAPITLSRTSGEVQRPAIAIDDAGEAIAVWEVFEGDRIVQSATRATTGTWSAPISLTPKGMESGGSEIAMNDAGEAVVLWDTRLARSLREVTKTTFHSPGGTWSAPVKVVEGRVAEIAPAIAISPTGEAIVIWERFRERSGREYSRIESASHPAGGAWSKPTNLAGKGGPSFEAPAIAIGPDGEAVAVWTRSIGPLRTSIQSASRLPGSAWTSPVDVYQAHAYELPHLAVAIDAAGDTVAVWQEEQKAIQSASRSPTGVWSDVSNLVRPGQTLFPQIDISPAGEAAAIWDGSGIQSAFGTFGAQ